MTPERSRRMPRAVAIELTLDLAQLLSGALATTMGTFSSGSDIKVKSI